MLEYGYSVGHSSLTIAQARSLHRAQRVTMAGNPGQLESSHMLLIQELGLERLALRREAIRKRFAKHIPCGVRHHNLFTPLNTNTRRGSHGFFFPEIQEQTGTYYSVSFTLSNKIAQPTLGLVIQQHDVFIDPDKTLFTSVSPVYVYRHQQIYTDPSFDN